MLLYTMKLNQRPKPVTTSPGCSCSLFMLLLIINSVCQHLLEPVGASQPLVIAGGRSTSFLENPSATRHLNNETLTAPEAVEPNQRLHVTDLRLTSDYRAVKLHWTYAHSPSNAPVSFNVRYCELTSWNIEIKCKRKELRVITTRDTGSGAATNHGFSTPASQDVARQLEPAQDEYAAQIYDLRALTNYTFQVWLGRLALEPPTRALRRLDDASLGAGKEDEWNSLQKRVETKPFSAEATRCLANSSEVLVTTGKYFGGRISVEDSLNPRCSLLGNKSSEQTSYLFRIDHEACESKLMNGNRVEAMILVHENKDILTHNTARFLVLCNFNQYSFTLRASMSLPKVHGTGARPAVISPVSSREAHSVSLGSMPGIFRARSATEPAPTTSESKPSASSSLMKTTTADELETNSIAAASQKGVSGSKELMQQRRIPKELSSLSVPEPVQVQSKLLFVGQPSQERLWASRARGLTSGRSIMQASVANQISAGHESGAAPRMLLSGGGDARQLSAARVDASSGTIESPATFSPSSSELALVTGAGDEQQQSAVNPIIITNNHRTIYSEMQSLARSQPSPAIDEPQDNYSIRYSAAPVNEYNVQSDAPASNPLLLVPASGGSPLKLRPRSGRMRTLNGQQHQQELPQQPANYIATASEHTPSKLLSKMGEVSPPEVKSSAADLQMLDSSQDMSGFVPANASLAHNITSYLIKWSLRTLTNLARKSIESLIVHPTSKLNNINETTSASLSERTHSQASSSQPPVSTTATTSTPQAINNQLKTTSETRTTVKPVRPLELDGFLISSGSSGGGFVVDGKPAAGAESIARAAQLHHHQQQPQKQSAASARPSNYSKSLDLSRDSGPVSQHIGRSLSRFGWLLYALLLAAALAFAAFIGICIVFGRPRKRNLPRLGLDHPTEHQQYQHPAPVVGGGAPPSAGIGNPTLEDLGDTIGEHTYQRYDYNKFDSDTINKRALLAEEKSKLRFGGHKQHLHPHAAHLTGSTLSSAGHSTRSTSVNGDDHEEQEEEEEENDCKNSEFFYTEHVLINTETNHFGESYA